MKSKQYLFGSVSSGTMREEDLIPCFIDTIKYFNKSQAKRLEREEVKLQAIEDEDEKMDLLSYFLNETLFDALNDYAPPYHYFGSHPGDGTDYGFWLSEGFQDDFEGLKVDDLSDIPQDYAGEVLEVNDHGNMTLYACRKGQKLTEIWSYV